MESGLLGLFVVLLLVANSMILLVHRDWRWVQGALAIQYLLAFLLITPVWPLELAAVKLVGGWMATAIHPGSDPAKPGHGERGEAALSE
jgi:hypothetical protein